MTFTTSRMLNSKVLVKGTDLAGTTGSTVVDSSQWDEIKDRQEFSQATDVFEKAVNDFYAPLVAAAENVKALQNKPTDPIGFVVFEEATEGKAAKPGDLVKLNSDSIILRLVESGDTDRLVWLDESTLGVLEVAVPVTVAQPTAAEVGAEATGLPLDED